MGHAPSTVFLYIFSTLVDTEAVPVRGSLGHKPYTAETEGTQSCEELALLLLPVAVLCLASPRGQYMVMSLTFLSIVRKLLKTFSCHQGHYHVRCHHLLPFQVG